MIPLTITGTQNSVNPFFTLSYVPTNLELYRNGLLLTLGLDYTVLLNHVTFLAPNIPDPGDVLQAFTDTASYPAGTSPTTYQFITLTQLIAEISDLLDDSAQVYWTPTEITYAIYEGLLYWGALTGFWKRRGAFTVSAYQQQFVGAYGTPYVDLSVYLPSLRRRSFTLDRVVREIQYALLETAGGISGTGMSQQLTVASILTALKDARNRFVQDAKFPISYHIAPFATPNPSGLVPFSQNSVFVHRAAWKDTSGIWTPLWREDAWAADHGDTSWTTTPGTPRKYSESENSPLLLQLIPPPSTLGSIEALTVDSINLDLTAAGTLFDVPDEWMHAIKYAALAELLSGSGQINDPLRSDYCEKRYAQSVEFAKKATSVIRVMVNGVPTPTDALSKVDLGNPGWMNGYGQVHSCGVLYDWIVPIPSNPQLTYGYTVDVVMAAPMPALPDYVQLGEEDIRSLKDYVQHILLFKCGGKDFTNTFSDYDAFMEAVRKRTGINKAKINYLSPLFQLPHTEQGVRPDRVEERQGA